jgi:eukaryotic-like serine/threonine-protein kinase
VTDGRDPASGPGPGPAPDPGPAAVPAAVPAAAPAVPAADIAPAASPGGATVAAGSGAHDRPGGPVAAAVPGGGTVAWSAADEPPRGALRPPAAEPPATAEVLAGRFRIVRFIGHGGMGDVYEAEDLELGERVALKLVRAEIALVAGTLERFRREIHLARKVTHPNVCRIFDVFRHRPEGGAAPGAEITFLSMELLAGETLEQRLRAGGRLHQEEALPIVVQITEALTAAHRAGVIHRDLKPANIMLVPTPAGEPRAVVTDFGLARAFGEGENLHLTVHGDILGTPSYMAPEQVTGGEVTAATDIYALGAMVYEMVTGTPPFVGETNLSTAVKRLHEDPLPPRRRVPDLDPAWDAAILRCLERSPADRFAEARDVAAALGGERLAPGPRQRRRRRRRVLAAAAAVIALAVLAAAGSRWLGAPRGRAIVASAASPLATLFSTPEGLYANAMKLLGKRDALRARELLDKAVAARRDAWLAHSGLAVALADLGRDERAREEAKLAFDHAAALPREQRLLVTARYWQIAHRWDKAVESYRQLQGSSPDDLDYGLRLVEALNAAGSGGEAMQLLGRLRQRPALATAAGTAALTRLDLAEAELDKSRSDFPHQGEAARRARAQAERDGDDLLAARALFLEGTALNSQGNAQAALDAFSRAGAIYAGTADQRSLAQMLAATATVLYYQGKFQLARDKAKEALDSFKEVGDLRGESQALDTLAAIEGEQGNLAGAQSRYATAIETYRRLGDRAHEARATGNLGLSLKMQGKLDEAARRFEEALALDRQLQDRGQEALQLFRLAVVSFDQLELGKAESYLGQSLSAATAIDDQSLIVDALTFAGEAAAARGDLVAARAKQEQALTRSRDLGDKKSIAENQLALAGLELDKDHPSQAQSFARLALDQFHSEHMQDQEAEAGALLARALLAQHAAAEAESAVQQAERLAAKSADPETRITVAVARARVAAAAARPEEALRILGGALGQARAAGLASLGLEVRLAMGEVESEAGGRQRAAADLAALESEARSHGFRLIADRAARARAGGG